MPKLPEAVFFDFDGVLVDSVPIKTEAFAQLFRPHGESVVEKVVDYHLRNGGVSRFEKFRHIHREFLGQEASAERLKELGERFSSLVYRKVLEAPLMPGALETLRTLKEKGIPCFVVSGTPQEELWNIVRGKCLDALFRGVFGSPPEKAQILKTLLSKLGADAANCLFVGDSPTDYEAARASGIPFLGIVPEASPSPFPRGASIDSKPTLSLE